MHFGICSLKWKDSPVFQRLPVLIPISEKVDPANRTFHEAVHAAYLVVYEASFFNNTVLDPTGPLHSIIHDALHALVEGVVCMDYHFVEMVQNRHRKR